MTRRTVIRKALLLLAASLFPVMTAWGQFYPGGGDPGSIRWRTLRGSRYEIVYPAGMDSLARAYASRLEEFRPKVSVSTGLPWRSRRIPVVMHGYTTTSNGMVSWAPRRLELYAQPQVHDPEPLYWQRNLAVHESRHLSQMQAGYTGVFRWMRPLFGEIVPGAVSGVYPGPALLEGDAVVAETALTEAGRGRSADFLEYYHWAFDNGDWRDWYRWRYGSWKYYAPNHYALGYLTIAGDRVFYDDPLFMQRYFRKISRRPLRTGNMRKEMKAASGKSFRATFREIQDSTLAIWRRDDKARGTFMGENLVYGPTRQYEDYSDMVAAGGRIFATREGKAITKELVEIGDKVRRIRTFSDGAGRIRAVGGRLWWSEEIPGTRWSLGESSRIRYMEVGDWKIHDLTKKGRFYNPAPSPDGTEVAAVEYPYGGGCAVVILSAADGSETERIEVPDTLDVYQVAWGSGRMVAAAVSPAGAGIYELPGFKPLLGPMPASIHNLDTPDGVVFTFASDRNGVNEIYSLQEDNTVWQETNTRYGTKEALVRGGEVRYLMETGSGHQLYVAPQTGRKAVNINDIHSYYLADALSRQEEALSVGIQETSSGGSPADAAEKRYPKVFPKFHSWVPLFVSMSGDLDDDLVSSAKPGATAFFQNPLGNLYGSLAYGYIPSPDLGGDYRHTGHVSLTCTAFYPVISFEADFGDRKSVQYRHMVVGDKNLGWNYVTYQYLTRPLFSGKLKVSVPLNFSSGGVLRGLTPSIKYKFSNDLYDKSSVYYTDHYSIGGGSFRSFSGYEKGSNVFMQQLDLSLRGYAMRETAEAAEYPRVGIGAEAGYHARVGLTDFYSSGVYGYVYGYLPGLTRTQGLRLTALYQHRFTDGVLFGENSVSTVPRGFVSTGAKQFLANSSPDNLRLTADYAVPFWVGDISFLSPLFYVRNFVLTPHADITMMSFGNGLGDGSLASIGADLTARLANFLWLPYDTAFGLTFDWKKGKSWNMLHDFGIDLGSKFYIGAIFTVSL